jgi:hypothetical protein
MGGDIIDDPIRICPKCLAVYIEDSVMYRETDRCPGCGSYLTDDILTEEEEDGEIEGY